MGKALEARAVSARFHEQVILREVTLHMPVNQVTAIIGPPGCGKSTFIRCLNRLHETAPGATMSGEVLLDGHSVYDMDPTEVRRSVAMIFHRPNPFPTMSIFDNVAAGLRLHGLRNRAKLAESAEQAACKEQERELRPSVKRHLTEGRTKPSRREWTAPRTKYPR